MGHGGAREGSGRPGKYTDRQGNPIPTRTGVYPACLTKEDLERLAREKLEKQQEDNKS